MKWTDRNPGLWFCPDGQSHSQQDISPFRGWVCGRCYLAYYPPLVHVAGRHPAFFIASGTRGGAHLEVRP